MPSSLGLKISVIMLLLLLTGCTTRRSIEIAPIKIVIDVNSVGQSPPGESTPNPFWEALARKTVGDESAIGQITLGCLSYRAVTGRWPKSKDDLAEGITSAELPSRLSEVESVAFTEEDEALVVNFTLIGKVRSSGTLRLNFTKNGQSTLPASTDGAQAERSSASAPIDSGKKYP